MMEELLLKNCVVYDPIQGMNGETMDIAIRNGRIVEKVSSGAKVIDVETVSYTHLTLPTRA